MDRNRIEEAFADYTGRLLRLSEQKITEGEQIYDTMGDIGSYGVEIDEDWTSDYSDITDELKNADSEEFKEAVAIISKHYYGALPEQVAEVLRNRSEETFAVLRDMINPEYLEKDTNSADLTKDDVMHLDEVFFATSVAGKMKTEEGFRLLADTFKKTDAANEKILEDIVTAISCPEAIPVILELLDDKEIKPMKRIYVMQMICNSGVKNDDIYRAMKKAYKESVVLPDMEIMSSMVMFDYGDPRIVTAMRAHVQRKIELGAAEQTADGKKKDSTDIYILLSMINKLGGRTDDMTGGRNLFEV